MSDEHDRRMRELKSMLTALAILVLLLFAAALMSTSRGCSTAPKDKTVTVTTTSTSTATDAGGDPCQVSRCGPLCFQDVRRDACETGSGFKEWTCGRDGQLSVTRDDCRQSSSTGTGTGTGRASCDDVVTFDELQPVLAQNCVSCHAGRDSYDNIKGVYVVASAYIASAKSAPNHMPPAKDLPDAQKALFNAWGEDGFLRAGECETGADGDDDGDPLPQVTRAQEEAAAFQDASRTPAVDQKDIVYLSLADRIDAGASEGELAVWKQAAAKALAMVSVDRALQKPREISPGLLKVNVDDLKINGAKWQKIEDAALRGLERQSKTSTGLALQALTGKRLPIIHVSEFIDAALHDANVYAVLLEQPDTFPALTAKLGCDYLGDLAAFRAKAVGFNGSLLSPAANRLMTRHECDDGPLYTTYDTGPIVSDQQNLLKNPCLDGTGCKAQLKFAAGEALYVLPNGMLGGYLALAKQVERGGVFDHSELDRRLEFADPAVVSDYTTNPLRPFIRLISCARCHAGGMIRPQHGDEVGPKVRGGGTLDAGDARIVNALFPLDADMERFYQRDNAAFTEALRKLGVDPEAPDPISRVSDHSLGDLQLRDVAGYLLVTEAELRECLAISREGSDQCGQLATGGTCSHDQLRQVVDVLNADCGLLEDPLTGEGD